MRRSATTSCPGFTLVELLTVIVVLAVLIAIMAPAIGGAVIASREAVLLSRLRGITQATEAYAGDHRMQLPQAGIPHEPEFSIYTGYLWRSYFAQSGFWTVALWPYFGEPNHPGMYSPWDEISLPRSAASHYPSIFQQNIGMFTQPQLWSPTHPVIDESQLVAPNSTAVAFPSNKTAFFVDFPLHLFDDSLHGYIGTQPAGSVFNTPIAFADGAARLLPYQDLPPAISDPWWTKEATRVHPGYGRLLRTIDGVLGRDF